MMSEILSFLKAWFSKKKTQSNGTHVNVNVFIGTDVDKQKIPRK